jgi:hypothetical protein
MTGQKEHGDGSTWLLAGGLVCLIAYVPSSGPVLAIAFWLREATGWDGFYNVMWLYYPLLIWGHGTPIDAYIEWWVELLGTVGPG